MKIGIKPIILSSSMLIFSLAGCSQIQSVTDAGETTTMQQSSDGLELSNTHEPEYSGDFEPEYTGKPH